MKKISAFVARSFADKDEQIITPIIKHLEGFRDLGFIWVSAERAEAECVSEKVQRTIDECDVFIGILTKRHPVYELGRSLKGALRLLISGASPILWTPPGWVLQECGYALRAGKKMIIFLEPGVEHPQLYGDLEYVAYTWQNPTESFRRSTEMITKLIASEARISVNVSMTQLPPIAVPEQRSGVEEGIPDSEVLAETSPDTNFTKMQKALTNKDFEGGHQIYFDTLQAIRRGEHAGDEVAWTAIYHQSCFKAGHADSLKVLKALADENPENPLPRAIVADCLLEFREYREAVEQFKKVATLSDELKTWGLLRAVEALKQLKAYEEAESILRNFVATEAPRRADILTKLYDVFKLSGKEYPAYGIAELALHENPQVAALRFALGLDYNKIDLNELFLYHYDLLCSISTDDPASLHNLALAYDNCGLPIASVRHYKQAIALGETLSASNLGYKFIAAGMADEANELLKAASRKDGCVPEVSLCLASLSKRDNEEQEKRKALLEKAAKQREFLISLGKAFLDTVIPDISGKWRLPLGDISLTLSGNMVTGRLEKLRDRSFLRSLLALSLTRDSRVPEVEPPLRKEYYQLSAVLTGRLCKFEIRREETEEAFSRSEPIEGYIVFEEDGHSALVAEIKDRKLDRIYEIERLD